MNFSKLSLLFFMLLSMVLSSNAQLLVNYRAPQCNADHSERATILYKGASLDKDNMSDGPYRLFKGMAGKLSVAKFSMGCKSAIPAPAIGFKVGIKNHRSNTLWMFSEQTFYEVELEELLKKCEWGDQLIFMTVDRKYELSRHEIVVMEGC